MKFDISKEYNAYGKEADEAYAHYTAGSFNLLGKIALNCVRLQEITKYDDKVNVKNEKILSQYFDTIYMYDPVLVLKIDEKIFEYTRNNVCKSIRGLHVHAISDTKIQKQKMNKKQKIKHEKLIGFIKNEISAQVLFCVKSGSVGLWRPKT